MTEENNMMVTSDQGVEVLDTYAVPEATKPNGLVTGLKIAGGAFLGAVLGIAGGWKLHKAKADKEFDEKVDKRVNEILVEYGIVVKEKKENTEEKKEEETNDKK